MNRIGIAVRCVVDVGAEGPYEGTDLCRQTAVSDQPDCFTLAVRCSCRTGLDNIDTNVREA